LVTQGPYPCRWPQPAAYDNRDLRTRAADAIVATPPPNALSNALSALQFHSIEAIFIFAPGDHMIRGGDTAGFQ